jgi:small subunit ribosomal protein S20
MAITLSAKKRVRQNGKRRALGRSQTNRVKNAAKRLLTALNSATAAEQQVALQAQYRATVALIQRTAGKGTIHRNKAANLVSSLTKRLHATLGAKA